MGDDDNPLMLKLILSGDTIPEVRNPSWEMIEVGLLSLTAAGNSFLILGTEADGHFVQACGDLDALVVEVSSVDCEGKQTVRRLGRKGALRKDRDKGTLLDITDALICFERFFNDGTIPKHYGVIDITPEALR